MHHAPQPSSGLFIFRRAPVDYARRSIVPSNRLTDGAVSPTITAPSAIGEIRVRRFDLVTPVSIDDCLGALKGRGPKVKVLAGGTDLIAQLKVGMLKVAVVVDLSGVADLRVLEGDAQRGFRIGAAVTARTLVRSWARSRSATSRRSAAMFATRRHRRTWRRRWWRSTPRRSSPDQAGGDA